MDGKIPKATIQKQVSLGLKQHDHDDEANEESGSTEEASTNGLRLQ